MPEANDVFADMPLQSCREDHDLGNCSERIPCSYQDPHAEPSGAKPNRTSQIAETRGSGRGVDVQEGVNHTKDQILGSKCVQLARRHPGEVSRNLSLRRQPVYDHADCVETETIIKIGERGMRGSTYYGGGKEGKVLHAVEMGPICTAAFFPNRVGDFALDAFKVVPWPGKRISAWQLPSRALTTWRSRTWRDIHGIVPLAIGGDHGAPEAVHCR